MSSVPRETPRSPATGSKGPAGLLRGPVEEIDEATIRFAGDSGDGMQLAGLQFSATSAILGNGTSAVLHPPSEIRAPAGTLGGVSSFQIHISRHETHTPGDVVSTLVAMNPAALRANLADLEPGGILIVNTDTFIEEELLKAGYETSPLQDGSLKAYRVFAVPISTLNREAVARVNLSPREADRCKNFFALGLVCWLYERPLDTTLSWIREKFAKNPGVQEANGRSLRAGFHFGETTEVLPVHFRIGKADVAPGRYRRINGSEALALGLVAAAQSAELPLVFASYPITPATDLLQYMSDLRSQGVKSVQVEDEMAAINVALGAAFGGALGATATSGPGMCLKAEGLALAVSTELPCVVIDVQRGGPSTGLPTKTEQADLLQALFGRHGECPLVVLAASSPADGFACVYEAVRLAVNYMTPVIVLSDAALASSAEAWKVPDVGGLPPITVRRPAPTTNGVASFLPYKRDARLVRPWAVPGMPGLEHRLGGLEKEDITGDVSYDPLNHEWMTQTRAKKIDNIAHDIPPLEVAGPEDAELLVLGWGGTFGAIEAAVGRSRRKGLPVASAHLRYLNPLPANTGEVLRRHRRVLVPELNAGQLLLLLRARYLVDAVGLNKVQGRPFRVAEIEKKIEEMLEQTPGA